MHLPFSTYRVQFNKDFTFQHLLRIIPYLDKLGITTIYASPILQAALGSMHGYDVTDPLTINSEIGTLEELKEISAVLKANGMGWVQDIVPNHMAFDTRNDRLMDVFERGEFSTYKNYFDVNWNHPSTLEGKVMVPFLGKELLSCLDEGEIKVSFSPHGFTIDYFDTHYPLSIAAYEILHQEDSSGVLKKAFDQLGSKAKELTSIKEWRRYKNKFFEDNEFSLKAKEVVKEINKAPKRVKELLDQCNYALTFWKASSEVINYRRFFTVNGLICLKMEDEMVFQDYHQFLHQLRMDGFVQGFRIDHIDGLFNPTEYIKRLRNLVGIDTYIVAEKILEEREGIPMHWEIEGTSGYEFLAHVSQLFTDRIGGRKILGFYKSLVPGLPVYKELVLQNKKLILKEHMAGEWQNLTRYFSDLGLMGNHPEEKIKEAIGLLMLSLPVYRIYPDALPLQGEDQLVVQATFVAAQSLESDCHQELQYLESLFMNAPESKTLENNILFFLRRLMQFTGPLTAKGVEDTTFYVYNPLISHDEVGDSPSRLGISIPEFHRKMIDRQRSIPLALNATATHDTKRGEDARLRLNVLSELADEWIEHVQHWLTINQKFVNAIGGRNAPDVNETYFIYQSLVGGFPADFVVTEDFVSRTQTYLTKVIREAKVNSNWETPDEEYEKACLNFVHRILHDEQEFLKSFVPFMRKVVKQAMVCSLGQTLIKITAPGIPDTYQGTELWDLSFVDPDNRRPVDYELRIRLLDAMQENSNRHIDEVLAFVRENENAGTAKLFVTWKALNFRKQNSELFIKGDYIPLEITGDEISALAFARRHDEQWLLVIVPLSVRSGDSLFVDQILLPKNAPVEWQNVFTTEIINVDQRFPLDFAFSRFPVAMFYSL